MIYLEVKHGGEIVDPQLDSYAVTYDDVNDALYYWDKPHEKTVLDIVYKTDVESYSDEVDFEDMYAYDGTIELEGNTYHKWQVVGYPHWLLTDTTEFGDVSLENPYTPVGYIMGDEATVGENYNSDCIVLKTTKTYEKRDVESLDKNGQEYVDLGLPTGTLWAKFNVGAASETEYGKYFAWGDTEGHYEGDGHVFNWSTAPFNNGSSRFDDEYFASVSGTVCPNGVLSLEYDSAHAQMGGDWRMPSNDDIREFLIFTTNEWVEDYEGSGVSGRVFTSKKNGNAMFIPAAGTWLGSGVDGQGNFASLWGTLLHRYSNNATLLDVDAGYSGSNISDRYIGLSVRGVL